jgi:thymidylate synthase
MFKANEIYRRNLINLLDSEYNTEGQKVRPFYKDGTPAHTRFINNICDTYDISKDEYPITNYRSIAWKSAIKEILWIYQDQSNNLDLLNSKYGIKWWDDWEVNNHDYIYRNIGTRYGATIKKYNLMNKLLKGLKEEPYSRRHIMNMYQYADFEESAGLNPCVYETVWNVRGKYLDVFVNQRSSDYVTSEGINRLQYCALLIMVAKATGYEPGLFTYNVCNLHLYDRHEEQVKELLSRDPSDKQPKLILDTDKTNFYDFTIDDFKLIDFECNYPQLAFELAI